MVFYSIAQLQAKSVEELREIAKELKTPNRKSDEKQTLVYDILDKQAEAHSETKAEGTRTRRPRVSDRKAEEKKKTEAAAAAAEKNNVTAKDSADDNGKETEAVAEEKAVQTADVQEPVKKKRGRPSKAELAARVVVEAAETEKTLFSDINAETPDINAEAAKSDAPADGNTETIVVPEKPSKKKSVSKESPRSAASVKGSSAEEDFVIIRNVPVIEKPALLDAPIEIEPEPATRGRFRRFKEDPLVQSQVKAVTAKADEGSAALNPEIELIEGGGVLELMNEGYGFLRSSDYNYLSSPDDIYVPANVVRGNGLKTGDVIEGKVRIPKEGEKFFCIAEIRRINGLDPALVRDRVAFEHLTPLFPDEKFCLCSGKSDPLSCRIVDIFAPIGKGQRALIVAQPKTGKTWLMKDIANAIARNHPDTYMMMLLIDERPEEVTDMTRTVNAEVIASTFDEPASQHVKIANIVLEKAKRMVESGHDVVIFLDSITRLARAYNTVSPASGKVLTGGVEANSLQYPKRFFGAARNIEGGGSLTIIATALIDTGSKMDEVIFEEFKGTGNMELQLDRNLSNKRIYPSVNLVASSTRREDLLLDETIIGRMQLFRNILADMNPVEAMQELNRRMSNTLNNEEFLASMNG